MERRAIVVRGVVQGVGFRPFVYGLATRHALAGFVRNRSGSVWIEVEGDSLALDRFLQELTERPPPLAKVEALSWEARAIQGAGGRFRIEESDDDGTSAVYVSPDVATCPACLDELFDPSDRRFGYPFLNCTHCGPRLTIITGAPYDRQKTTMAAFAMCDACLAEYHDPTNRRFHAQPVACPACGPRLTLLDHAARPQVREDPLADFAARLLDGEIGALKGLGGFHLACDASVESAVSRLRGRKVREQKPFAVMVADVASASLLGEVGEDERRLLQSPRRPIVLLRKRIPWVAAESVAPGNPWIGVMLPYTPLHHLLLRAVAGRPLVMTSANRSDEPIVFRDEDVRELAGIADLFLVHDRPIHLRCDDSVTRVVKGVERPIRRSRGDAPLPIRLPVASPHEVLAVGGQLKGTFALARGGEGFLSHHLGDLDHYEAFRAFRSDVELYEKLFAIRPSLLVHDLHPEYATTRYATERSARERIPLLGVQHHHAHLASCMAENGLTEPVIGVTFDGTGYGTDGAIWGGEFLVGDLRNYRRAAHLRYVGLPGGDRAVREPWRMATAHLKDAGVSFPALEARILQVERRCVDRMLERRINCPPTSSMGRLFDAVAAIAGVCDRVDYEGQAAVELEWLAAQASTDRTYPFEIVTPSRDGVPASPLVIDTRPLIRAVLDDANEGLGPGRIARRFHTSLVEITAAVCRRLREETGVRQVVFGGGVWLNMLLSEEACATLEAQGFRVYRHHRVPPNDGGLSLGQLAVAAAQST